jgi:hypothetical protein
MYWRFKLTPLCTSRYVLHPTFSSAKPRLTKAVFLTLRRHGSSISGKALIPVDEAFGKVQQLT